MSTDLRSPEQRLAEDLMHLICSTYSTHGHVGKSQNVFPRRIRPEAQQIHTVVGGVRFTITVEEGYRRS